MRMPVRAFAVVLLALTAVLSACQAPAAASPLATPTTAPSPAASSGGATPNPATRVSGKVAEITMSTLTFEDGKIISIANDARVTRSEKIAVSDLKTGEYVAVTAQRQPDNTLLASVVNVFEVSGAGGNRQTFQRPMTGGNLMTNANIEKINGDTFTVTWDGGGANVKLAPDAKLYRIVEGKFGDIKVGDTIAASVVDGIARNISIQ